MLVFERGPCAFKGRHLEILARVTGIRLADLFDRFTSVGRAFPPCQSFPGSPVSDSRLAARAIRYKDDRARHDLLPVGRRRLIVIINRSKLVLSFDGLKFFVIALRKTKLSRPYRVFFQPLGYFMIDFSPVPLPPVPAAATRQGEHRSGRFAGWQNLPIN